MERVLRDRWTDEEYREKVLAAQRDPLVKQKKSKAVRAALAKPETKKRMSSARRRLWSQDDYRAARVESGKAMWAEADFKQHGSSIMVEKWKDEDYRAKVMAARRVALLNPEVHEKLSKSNKKKWEDPAYKANQEQKRALQPPRGRFKGVWSDGTAMVQFNGERIHLGTHKTPEQAARVYDAVVRFLYCGQPAYVNFPMVEDEWWEGDLVDSLEPAA